jgi:hypothetical protein
MVRGIDDEARVVFYLMRDFDEFSFGIELSPSPAPSLTYAWQRG